MSQITTHVLDTGKAKPAWGVAVVLNEKVGLEWNGVAKGIINKEGRVTSLLQDDEVLDKGVYKISFDTKPYLGTQDIESFFPFVEIVFKIKTTDHYHIPLLVSPFGYSTYRGC